MHRFQGLGCGHLRVPLFSLSYQQWYSKCSTTEMLLKVGDLTLRKVLGLDVRVGPCRFWCAGWWTVEGWWALLQAPEAALCPSWSPHLQGRFPRCGNISSSAPTTGVGPVSFPLFFFFLSSHLVVQRFFLSFQVSHVLAAVQLQQELCENFSIGRCVVDVFVSWAVLHVLFFHLDLKDPFEMTVYVPRTGTVAGA